LSLSYFDPAGAAVETAARNNTGSLAGLAVRRPWVSVAPVFSAVVLPGTAQVTSTPPGFAVPVDGQVHLAALGPFESFLKREAERLQDRLGVGRCGIHGAGAPGLDGSFGVGMHVAPAGFVAVGRLAEDAPVLDVHEAVGSLRLRREGGGQPVAIGGGLQFSLGEIGRAHV
jgi:hypothetical protein